MPDTRTAPFRRAVIGLNGGPTDILAVRLACQLARPTKAALVGVHVVEVDWTRDLSEDVASDNEAASAGLDPAAAAGGPHQGGAGGRAGGRGGLAPRPVGGRRQRQRGGFGGSRPGRSRGRAGRMPAGDGAAAGARRGGGGGGRGRPP